MKTLRNIISARNLYPAYLVIVLFVLTVYVFYPGFMSVDSCWQLRQARGGGFTDHHPPVMGFIWRFMDRMWPGPQGMLILHNIMFFAGVLLLAFTFFDTNRKRLLFILCFSLFPSIWGFLGIIWKDVGMGVALLLGFAGITASRRFGSRSFFILGMVSLFYALLVRHNAFTAVLPICLYAGFVAVSVFNLRSSRLISIFAGVLVFLLLGVSSLLINRALTDRKTHMYQGTLLFDLVGVSLRVQEDLVPKAFRGMEVDGDYLPVMSGRFSQNSDNSLFKKDNNGKGLLKRCFDEKSIKELKGAWFSAIREHPIAYLKHRLRHAQIHYSIMTPEPYVSLHLTIINNEFGIVLPEHKAQRLVVGFLGKLTGTFLFRGITYILLLIGAVFSWITFCGMKLRSEVITMVSSVILLCGLNFIALPASDMRYFWWLVLVVMLFLFMLLMGVKTIRPGFMGNGDREVRNLSD